MRFLPYEELNMRTRLNSNEVFYRLRYAVKTKSSWHFFRFSTPKPYEGKVSRNSFEIMRYTWYRNSFKPVISGKIIHDFSGSQVHIVMRLCWPVLFFWIFWLGSIAYFGLSTYSERLVLAIHSQLPMSFTSWDLIPIGMFAFGYLLALISFKLEAETSRKFLFDLLRVQQIDNDILFEETLFGLSESQILSLALLAVAVIAVGYFAIKLLA